MNKAGLLPKLRLGIKNGGRVTPTGPHKVKIVEDKLVKKLNTEGVEEFFVRYVFEENGQRMQYDCHMKAKVGNDPHYLVQALAEVEPGEELILEMKKAGVKSYIEVTRVALGQKETVEADDDGSPGEMTFQDEPNLE
ncbi:MAG: hypothetical protein BGP12_06870 [Rhodospirillales bacterium 70-18]|nr:MAG: hypothetical protein BGP12_06870 [Rhodospirillales bacterium 70-18]